VAASRFGQRYTQTSTTEFTYNDSWHPTTHHTGPSLERLDPAGADLTRWENSLGWCPSFVSGGTPGGAGNVLPGDAKQDGIFASSDLLQVLAAGEFEDNLPGNSTWDEGDFSGDDDFDSFDLILAFGTNTYQGQPKRPAVDAALAAAD
jgi:hypothetical protein